jgi:hypothetical protein
MKVLFDDASKLSNRRTQYFWEQKLKTKQLLQSGDFSLSTFYFLSFMCKRKITLFVYIIALHLDQRFSTWGTLE